MVYFILNLTEDELVGSCDSEADARKRVEREGRFSNHRYAVAKLVATNAARRTWEDAE